ncbi:transposase orfb [Gigaspora margarita]|uniref:Transposase orfb n=1 Tax=Gigaspora margarita TaxID=4874 RepID=A0A8H3WZJ5_GIGMA|nr:transposase orfb [Gigaspora margarita]
MEYSLKNTRAVRKTVFIRGKRFTILLALSLNGIITVDIMEGTCNKELFKQFIINKVILSMQPYPHANSVLVLNNARIHHNSELVKYIEAFGCKVEYLPPYSPDMNPIETAFA